VSPTGHWRREICKKKLEGGISRQKLRAARKSKGREGPLTARRNKTEKSRVGACPISAPILRLHPCAVVGGNGWAKVETPYPSFLRNQRARNPGEQGIPKRRKKQPKTDRVDREEGQGKSSDSLLSETDQSE